MGPGGSESSERLSLSFRLSLTFLNMTQKQKQKKTSRRILRPTETHKDLLVETGAALWCQAHQLSMCSTLEKNWCLNTQHPAKKHVKIHRQNYSLLSNQGSGKQHDNFWRSLQALTGKRFFLYRGINKNYRFNPHRFPAEWKSLYCSVFAKTAKNTTLKTQASYYS